MPATVMAPLIPIDQKFETTVEDIEYQHPDGISLLARVFRPVGTEAYAAVLDVHGGAWVLGDRTLQQAMCQALASSGVVVASIDFRMPPNYPYPTSLVDTNFAIRWVKQQAHAFGTAEGAPVGISGGSSGGHVVILAGMRPAFPDYCTLPLPGGESLDASVAFVVTDAPVTDPIARFQDAVNEGRNDIIEKHHMYWKSEAQALDANPNLILKRGEAAEMPPLLVTQGTDDKSVPLRLTEEFVERYRKAGGDIEFHTFAGLGHGFILAKPELPESVQQATWAIEFVQKHARQAVKS